MFSSIKMYDILLFVWTFFTIVHGQTGALYGTVVAANTHEPLPYANIYLDSTDYGTFSDLNGFFSIVGVPAAGDYRLVVSYIGYERFETTCEIRSGRRVSYHVALQPEAVAADSVLVTANRPRTQNGIPISMVTVNPSELRITPTVGEPDIFRVLETFPGITTVNDFNVGLYVRGGNRNQNQVLLDGIPIYNPYHAMSFFSTFDAEATKQIALHKSGMDPTFGNYLSSLLDVHLKDGRSDRTSIQTNISLVSSRLFVEGPLPWGSYMASARRTYIDLPFNILWRLGLLDYSNRFPYHFTDGITSLVIKPTPTNRFKVTAYYSRDVFLNSVVDNDLGHGNFTWGNQAIGLSWDRLLSPALLLHADLSISEYRSTYLPPDTTVSNRINHWVLIRQVRPYLQFNSAALGTIRLGGELKPSTYFIKIEGFSHQPLSLDTTAANEHSVFITLNRDVGSFLSLKLGGRATYFAFQDTTVYSPQASLQINLGSRSDLTLHWGRYHQGVMTFGNEEIILDIFDAYRPVPAQLPVMKATHYVIGSHLYPKLGYEVSIEGYWKTFADLVEYNRYRVWPWEPDFVTGVGQSYGIEVLLKKGVGMVQGWLSYTYSHARKTISERTYPPKYDKPHDLSLVLSCPLPRKWRMGTRFVYHSGAPFTRIVGFYRYKNPFIDRTHQVPVYGDINAARLPPYHRLDVHLSRPGSLWKRPFEVYIDLINVYARFNILEYTSTNNGNIQMPPLITIGIRGEL